MELKYKLENQKWTIGLNSLYTCEVTDAIITIPGFIIESSLKGTHANGMSNKDVEALKFANSSVDFFPRGLGRIFPNLKVLQIYNCGLGEISRPDFIGFSSLEVLCLSRNQLKSLPDDLFADMPRLSFVYLGENLLERLSSKFLEPIKHNLMILWLQGNPLMNENFHLSRGSDLKAFMRKLDEAHLPPIEALTVSHMKHEQRFQKEEEFFELGKLSDFKIIVGEKEYKVHKFILASQSSVFEKIFTNKAEGGVQTIQTINSMANFNEKVFEDFLRYFYNGGVIRNEENVVELFELSVEFNVTNLKSECEELLLKTLNEANVIEIYNLGYQNGSEKLKRGALRTIQEIIPGTSDDLIHEKDLLNELITTKRRYNEIVDASKCFKKCELN